MGNNNKETCKNLVEGIAYLFIGADAFKQYHETKDPIAGQAANKAFKISAIRMHQFFEQVKKAKPSHSFEATSEPNGYVAKEDNSTND